MRSTIQYKRIKEVINKDLKNIRRYIDITSNFLENNFWDAYGSMENEFMQIGIPYTDSRKIMESDSDLIFFGGISHQFFYKSSFISVYNIFEHSLKSFCDLAHKVLTLKIEAKELNGNDIDRYYKYLDKIVGLDVKKINHIWEELNSYRLIRNDIVHENSDVHQSKNKEQLIRIINANKYLTIREETGEILIKQIEYLYNFIDLLEVFLNQLVTEFEKRIPGN